MLLTDTLALDLSPILGGDAKNHCAVSGIRATLPPTSQARQVSVIQQLLGPRQRPVGAQKTPHEAGL